MRVHTDTVDEYVDEWSDGRGDQAVVRGKMGGNGVDMGGKGGKMGGNGGVHAEGDGDRWGWGFSMPYEKRCVPWPEAVGVAVYEGVPDGEACRKAYPANLGRTFRLMVIRLTEGRHK